MPCASGPTPVAEEELDPESMIEFTNAAEDQEHLQQLLERVLEETTHTRSISDTQGEQLN